MLPIILLTLAPSIAICIYIYWQDKFDKEPKRLLVASFFLGVLSVIPTLIFSYIGQSLGFNHESNDLLWSVVSCIIGIGLVEEYSKFMFVRFYGYNKPAFNEPFDGWENVYRCSGTCVIWNHCRLFSWFAKVQKHTLLRSVWGSLGFNKSWSL
ncbi:MAG: PrsW family glutamic-type intramembrane protease [Cryomorphaceae bacterium]|nr:PrsW family glutamic-type intramembrane protease [Cryomorphaceae bacterium]